MALAPPSRLRRPRLGSGWNSLVRRLPDSLACALGVALGVKIGGVHHAFSVVLRGVLPRSLGRLRRLRPAGFGWGRVLECGTRQNRREPNPASDPRSGYALAYARSSNPPRRRISNAACPSAPFQAIFRAHFGALGAINAPRAPFSPSKRLPKAPQAACNSSGIRQTTCLTAAYLPGADSGPRPAPSRPRGARRDWGRARWALRGMVSQSSRNFYQPPE